MLVTKSLAGVIEHNMKYANKGSTLVLKPRADVEKTKQVHMWLYKNGKYSQKLF